MPDPSIPLSEYADRRRKLGSDLKGSIGVVHAGEYRAPLTEEFRPHPHFEYLTGVVDEPGAVVVLDPGNPVPARREMLFLSPLNPEVEQWDGLRLGVGEKLRTRTGFKAIFRTALLPRVLTESARRTRSLACLHPLAQYDQPVTPDLALFRKLAERIPNVSIEDATERIARMRSVKSAAEVGMIQRAVDITAGAFDTVFKGVAPGLNEFDVQEMLEHGYRTAGSRGPAFGTIAGTGVNSTVLHYRANDQAIADGELVCVDSGARFGGYGADITRTVPASGRFTKRQAEIYEIVLAALTAATEVVKPGVTFAQIDKAARSIIVKAGYGDAFMHGIGHHLGLETHDITPEGALRQGAVITIEPGIYLADEKIGVRIEDDVLVTKTGYRNLSERIPRTVDAIERAMGKGRSQPKAAGGKKKTTRRKK